MVAQIENTVDAAKEKHVPVIKKTDSGVKISVGEVAHPMEEDHYIEWIEMKMIKADKIVKKYLKPGDAPEIECPSGGKDVEVRAYCNLHGLWKS
jgi:superoxide reductase